MKVYLCGPINGCSDAEAKNWREAAKEKIAALSWEAFDPMCRDYRGRELEPGIAGEIVVQDKADIRAVDALLVWYEKPSVGTSMEVLYAWENRKRVVVVDRSDKPPPPWLAYHANYVVDNLDAALAAMA